MKILHTSDWHVGKRLGRHDRMEEHRAVLDEVVGIAADREVDLVVHSGDLFDRPIPPVDSLQVALDALVRLGDGGRRPVIVVAGNHDSGELFEALAPFLERFGIHIVGRIKPPSAGGVISVETSGGVAHVAAFPFLRAAQTVDFMARADRWYGAYADRVRRICEAYSDAVLEAVSERPGVGLLVAHVMVDGVAVARDAPRGERELHIGQAYAATGQALPTALDYVALGHIHAPQPVPGVAVPAEYAGSLLQLDFGEAGEAKRVVLVEASPGVPASIESIPVTAGKPLLRVSGSWSQIGGRDDLDGAWLDLVVDTDGPDPGLADTARERFDGVVKVQARYERPSGDDTARRTSGRPWIDLYGEYHQATYGRPPAPALVEAFTAAEEAAREPAA